MYIQQIIKMRRAELGLTLKDIAKSLGVSEGTVSRYESGDIKNMGIDKIEDLARVLRCSPGYLMGWESSPEGSISVKTLSIEEERLIMAYRKLSEIEKDMVCRQLQVKRDPGSSSIQIDGAETG